MSSTRPAPSVGVSLMALVLVLVGLLCWMLAGSLLLMDSVSGLSAEVRVVRAALALGGLQMVLAWSLQTLRPWSLWLAPVVLVLVLMAGLSDVLHNRVMALGVVLTSVLAFSANLAIVLALHLPDLRAQFSGAGNNHRSGEGA